MISYKFDEKLDTAIKNYCYKHVISVTELFKSIWSSYASYYIAKKRWVLGVKMLKRLKDKWVEIDVEI